MLVAAAILTLKISSAIAPLRFLPLARAEFTTAQEQVQSTSIAQKALKHIQSGDFQTARSLLRASVRDFPNNVELWNLLGITETELHEPARARVAFERGLQIKSDSASLNENLGFLFYRGADYVSARKFLTRAIALGSDNPGVRFSLAAAKLRTGQETEALAELRALEKPLANVSEYWEERGRAELAIDPSAAPASFDHALQIAPNSSIALNGAAAGAERQGQVEKALAFLIRARTVHPDDAPTLLHFGTICLRLDLGPDALDALERAYRLQPANNAALYLFARAHIAMQNWQLAYDLFRELSNRVPNYAPAHYAMGWLDVRLNRPDDARKQLERSLSLQPNLVDARYDLAELALDNGQLDEAEKLLNTVLRQNPNHAKANMSIGDLLMRRGKLDEAEPFLENAIHQDPSLAAAHYKLSMLYFRKHDVERGQKEKITAANLTTEANRSSKLQLKLILPENVDQEPANK